MLRQSAGRLRAARLLQAAVIVAVAMLPLTALATTANARKRVADNYPPTAPTSLAATAGDSVVNLTWVVSVDNVGVTGYRVYRGGVQIGTVSGSNWTYSDTNVVNGTTYSYTVKAFDAAGNVSGASNTATATPQSAADSAAPSAPGNLTATGGDSSVGLKWSAATDNVGVTGYRVFRSGAEIASLAASTLSYSDPGLANGTSYSYTVKASDAAGNVSADSNMATATPSATQGTLPKCSSQPFCADYESGSYSQWWLHQWTINPDPTQNYTCQNEGSGTFSTVKSPVKQGTYAGKFEVYPSTCGSAIDRAEMNSTQAQAGGYPGQEWYYGWWTYFPSVNGQPQQWWSNGGDFNDITQFQSVDWTAWMYLGVDQGNYTPGSTSIYLDWGKGATRQHFVVANPLQYDHWYHFVLHAKWSTDPSVGFIELDADGAHAIPLTHGATLYNTTTTNVQGATAPGAYITEGVYRHDTTSTNTVIHDGFCRAADFATAAAC